MPSYKDFTSYQPACYKTNQNSIVFQVLAESYTKTKIPDHNTLIILKLKNFEGRNAKTE